MKYLRLGTAAHTQYHTQSRSQSGLARAALLARGPVVSGTRAPTGQTRCAAVTNACQLTDRAALGSPLG